MDTEDKIQEIFKDISLEDLNTYTDMLKQIVKEREEI